MRIVVSGTHASGKSTLIADFLAHHPSYRLLGDPFDDVDADDASGPASFAAQLRLTAMRLAETAHERDVISERGPLDFLAYLTALDALGRDDGRLLPRAHEIVAKSLRHVDLLVLVPLDARAPIRVPDDEDPALREAMDEALLDIADELSADGMVELLTVGGVRDGRVHALLDAVRG
jgi:hypothetical protein